MRINRLIGVWIALFLLSGCEFNLQRIGDLKQEVKQLSEENDKLKKHIGKQSNLLEKEATQLSVCLDELDRHNTGIAEKHSWWFKLWLLIGFFLVIGVFLVVFVLYYSIDFHGPKKQEIEEHRSNIASEKSIVAKIRSDGEKEQSKLMRLKEHAQSLVHEIEELKKQRAHIESEIEKANATHEDAIAKTAEADKKLKLLAAFKKT